MGRLAACAWVRRAGGLPLGLSPRRPFVPEAIDALIVTGGSDIDPALYFEPGGPWVGIDPERDRFEILALEVAARRQLPVLGICRGAQLLNVVAGGSLHYDVNALRRVTSRRRSLMPRKVVDVLPDSRLHGLLEQPVIRVNSLHDQAVKDLGEGLEVVARDRDGIVQAIEAADEPFRVGVQWHPEYLAWQAIQRRLFVGLVGAARG